VVKVIYQNEVADCGYACLAMVLTELGRHTEVRELRGMQPVSANGVRMSDLHDLALRLGLVAEGFQFERAHLLQIRRGAIVHFREGHFVVVEASRRRHVDIIDPARGRRRMTPDQFMQSTTGYLLQCDASAALQAVARPARSEVMQAMGAMFRSDPRLARQLMKIAFISLGVQFATLAAPYLGSLTLDQVVAENNPALLNVLIITFASVFAMGAFSGFMQAYLTEVVFQQLYKDSVRALFAKLMSNRFAYFEKRHVGDLFARLKSQREVVEFAGRSLVGLAVDLSMGLLALGLMLVQAPLLAGLAAALFLVYLVVAFLLYPAMRDAQRQQIETSARCDDALIETIRGAAMLKLAQKESQRTALFMTRLQGFINDSFRVAQLANIRALILKVVGHVDTLVITAISAGMMVDGELSVGAFYSFQIFKGLMSTHLSGAVNSAFQFNMLRVPVMRFNDIVEEPGERYEPLSSCQRAEETRSFLSLELRGVSFSYGFSEHPVLRNLDFSLQRGEKVAIVGPSGAGKSTLFKLLAAAESATRGQVRLNGLDYANLAVDEIRRHMAHMRQGDIILNGSIADNVSLFEASVEGARINALLQQVGLFDDVMRLPMRTLSMVSDTIANLSAGQRQRLLLARALGQQRELLLLDEPTSNLDRDSVMRIGAMLAASPHSMIVITHDQQLAALFERRYRLRDGMLEVV
jgi:ATP-binding cassette subfamily B protein RaxB